MNVPPKLAGRRTVLQQRTRFCFCSWGSSSSTFPRVTSHDYCCSLPAPRLSCLQARIFARAYLRTHTHTHKHKCFFDFYVCMCMCLIDFQCVRENCVTAFFALHSFNTIATFYQHNNNSNNH